MTTLFTREGYKAMLRQALLSEYRFLDFHDPERYVLPKVCLLRHDVDADLGAALEIAEIEASLGVRSTFFLMLRSPVYNLLSRANHRLLQKIIALNHAIGLHYDAGFCAVEKQSMQSSIALEVGLLENMFDIDIRTVSFHQPSQDVLDGKIQIDDYINTYSHDDLRGFKYISDSNKIWKCETPIEIFKDSVYSHVQLLIHPMWWVASDANLSTEALWNQTLLENWNRSQAQLLETERAYGEPRLFSIKEIR